MDDRPKLLLIGKSSVAAMTAELSMLWGSAVWSMVFPLTAEMTEEMNPGAFFPNISLNLVFTESPFNRLFNCGNVVVAIVVLF